MGQIPRSTERIASSFYVFIVYVSATCQPFDCRGVLYYNFILVLYFIVYFLQICQQSRVRSVICSLSLNLNVVQAMVYLGSIAPGPLWWTLIKFARNHPQRGRQVQKRQAKVGEFREITSQKRQPTKQTQIHVTRPEMDERALSLTDNFECSTACKTVRRSNYSYRIVVGRTFTVQKKQATSIGAAKV